MTCPKLQSESGGGGLGAGSVSALFSSMTQHPTQDLTKMKGPGNGCETNGQQSERINNLDPCICPCSSSPEPRKKRQGQERFPKSLPTPLADRLATPPPPLPKQ